MFLSHRFGRGPGAHTMYEMGGSLILVPFGAPFIRVPPPFGFRNREPNLDLLVSDRPDRSDATLGPKDS